MVLGFLFGRKKEDKVKFHFTGSNKKQAKKSKPKPKSNTKTKDRLKPKPKSKTKPKIKTIKKKILPGKKKFAKALAKRVKKSKKVDKVGKEKKGHISAVKKSQPKEVLIGRITHFFAKPSAGVIKLSKGNISLGDKIHIRGRHTDFIQNVFSLQIDNKPVDKAVKGKEVGLEVKERVRRKDKVYVLK